jgi:hypothetical protein
MEFVTCVSFRPETGSDRRFELELCASWGTWGKAESGPREKQELGKQKTEMGPRDYGTTDNRVTGRKAGIGKTRKCGQVLTIYIFG